MYYVAFSVQSRLTRWYDGSGRPAWCNSRVSRALARAISSSNFFPVILHALGWRHPFGVSQPMAVTPRVHLIWALVMHAPVLWRRNYFNLNLNPETTSEQAHIAPLRVSRSPVPDWARTRGTSGQDSGAAIAAGYSHEICTLWGKKKSLTPSATETRLEKFSGETLPTEKSLAEWSVASTTKQGMTLEQSTFFLLICCDDGNNEYCCCKCHAMHQLLCLNFIWMLWLAEPSTPPLVPTSY